MIPYILVLYYSKHGSTETMAKHIARGAKKVTTIDVRVRRIPDIIPTSQQQNGYLYCTFDDLSECSGLILGSPAYFGSIAAPVKHFIDQTSTLWMTGKLIDKPASVFTSASTMHGGHEICLQALTIPLLHHGMIIQGISYRQKALIETQSGGTPYGSSHLASGHSPIPLSTEEMTLCEHQGERLAKLVAKLHS